MPMAQWTDPGFRDRKIWFQMRLQHVSGGLYEEIPGVFKKKRERESQSPLGMAMENFLAEQQPSLLHFTSFWGLCLSLSLISLGWHCPSLMDHCPRCILLTLPELPVCKRALNTPASTPVGTSLPQRIPTGPVTHFTNNTSQKGCACCEPEP